MSLAASAVCPFEFATKQQECQSRVPVRHMSVDLHAFLIHRRLRENPQLRIQRCAVATGFSQRNLGGVRID